MLMKAKPLPPSQYCQLLVSNVGKLDVIGSASLRLKNWSTNEVAYLKFCLDQNIKTLIEVRALVQQRLNMIGKLNYREVMQKRGNDHGRADMGYSPVALAFAIENNVFSAVQLGELKFEPGGDAHTFLLEERRRLLDEVMGKITPP